MSAELYLVILNVLHSIMFSIFPRNSTIARGSKAYRSNENANHSLEYNLKHRRLMFKKIDQI